MTRTIRVTPYAQAEVLQAADWYDTQRPHWGQLFLEAYLQTIEHIRWNPNSYQRVGRACRRAVMLRFPFIVVYRITDDTIDIIGVLPTRASPAQLSTRVEDTSH